MSAVDTSGKGVKASVKTNKGEDTLEADVVLSAVGITTNIENEIYNKYIIVWGPVWLDSGTILLFWYFELVLNYS